MVSAIVFGYGAFLETELRLLRNVFPLERTEALQNNLMSSTWLVFHIFHGVKGVPLLSW